MMEGDDNKSRTKVQQSSIYWQYAHTSIYYQRVACYGKFTAIQRWTTPPGDTSFYLQPSFFPLAKDIEREREQLKFASGWSSSRSSSTTTTRITGGAGHIGGSFSAAKRYSTTSSFAGAARRWALFWLVNRTINPHAAEGFLSTPRWSPLSSKVLSAASTDSPVASFAQTAHPLSWRERSQSIFVSNESIFFSKEKSLLFLFSLSF